MVDTNNASQWENRFVGGSRFADGSAIIRPDQIAWTPAPWADAEFKLTHVDRESGMWTAVFKVEAGRSLPSFKNFGEVQIYVLDGGLETENGALSRDDYYLDVSGVVPARTAGPDGVVFFAMFAGGISLVDEQGHVADAYLDGGAMYDLAAANGAADFLPGPNRH